LIIYQVNINSKNQNFSCFILSYIYHKLYWSSRNVDFSMEKTQMSNWWDSRRCCFKACKIDVAFAHSFFDSCFLRFA